MNELLALMIALQLKHWYVDFVDQTMDEVRSKGHYGEWLGLWHSIKHGIGTLLVFMLIFDFDAATLIFGGVLGLLDFVTHYHIDWAKMNWGNRDITTPTFWAHLGADQMAHQLVYILIIGLTIS